MVLDSAPGEWDFRGPLAADIPAVPDGAQEQEVSFPSTQVEEDTDRVA